MNAHQVKCTGPRRYKVNLHQNSECDVSLTDLDWSHWWTGTGFSGKIFILHVPHKDTAQGSIHRVYCRHSDTPRLQWKDGILYWLVDNQRNRQRGKVAKAMKIINRIKYAVAD